jgi:hypothetical protein
MNESIKATGIIRIYEGKKEKLIAEYKNLVLDVSKKGLINQWAGNPVGYGKIDFLCIGTGTNPVTPTDATLGAENFRKPISDFTIYGSNRIVIDTLIATNEANFVWKELGLVSGGSWGTLNSGVLLNRALVSEDKNSGMTLTISWDITLT